MNLLQAIATLAGLSAPSLEALLRGAGEAVPDLKPTADEWLAKLEAELTPDALADVVLALPAELQNILKLKLQPTEHPGDFA
jgi:hypothetical protein